MTLEMKTIGLLFLLAVGSKASITKLFFFDRGVNLTCPLEAPFYAWRKFFNNTSNHITQDDKKLLITLKPHESPVIYQCSASTGFGYRVENITVYNLDRYSEKAKKLCSPSANVPEFPCFLREHYQKRLRLSRGESVTLDCETGGANVTYLWLKSIGISRNKALKIQSSNFEIKNFDEQNNGFYTCEVHSSTGRRLNRTFELTLSEEPVPLEKTEVINITSKPNKNQTLDCSTNLPPKTRLQAIKWGKKLDTIAEFVDKSLIIEWKGNSYKLLPESQIFELSKSESEIISYVTLREVTSETTGEYICVIVANTGYIKYKTFFLSMLSSPPEEEQPRSFFFLYILIPSMVIAVCLFIGIYLTVNRRPGRKATSFSTISKSENDTTRLRTTPDYSSTQYQARPLHPPPSVQYPPNPKYFNPYYPPSDKLMV